MKSATTLFQKTTWFCMAISFHCFALHAQDALFISPTGQVTVDNDLTIKGSTTVNKALTISEGLTAKGNATIDKTLTVSEGLTAKANIIAANGLNVTGGNVTIANALTTGGAIAANKGLTVKGVLTTDTLITNFMTVNNGVIQKGTPPVKIQSTDMGLYSHDQGHWIRLVTNKAPITFFTTTDSAGNNHKPDIVFYPDGTMGIGTNVANGNHAALEVNQTKTYSKSIAYRYLKNNGMADEGARDQNFPISIMATDRIVTFSEFNAYSDARIKKDLVRADATKDLATLNRIQVTGYKYIDTIAYDNRYKKGVIAQEVEQVFPEAVNKGEEFVPSIFSKPANISAGNGAVAFTMYKPHQLVNGDIVRLITASGNEEKKVTVTGKNSFTIEGDAAQYPDAFIFGKKVYDFLMVDYDRLSMLNISATQQLSKEIELLKKQNEAQQKQNEALQKEIALLKQKDAASQSAMANIESRLKSIETMQVSR